MHKVLSDIPLPVAVSIATRGHVFIDRTAVLGVPLSIVYPNPSRQDLPIGKHSRTPRPIGQSFTGLSIPWTVSIDIRCMPVGRL